MRAWRKRVNYDYRELCKQLEIGVSHYYAVERYERGLHFQKILKVCEISGGALKPEDFKKPEPVKADITPEAQ